MHKLLKNHSLWAITAYFNPMGYRRRLENFRVFRNRLTAPLIAVELSFGSEFDLAEGDADVLIQLRGQDVMFQKERLLNVALSALPAECQVVAWLDCDVIFEDNGWPERTLDALERNRVVQLFEAFHELPAEVPQAELLRVKPTATRRAWVAEIRRGSCADDVLSVDFRLQGLMSGGGWACHRELIVQSGFYDACIMGSGNRVFAAAAIGRLSDAVRYLRLTPPWREHYEARATPVAERIGGRIGCVEGAVRHLWHGDLRNRRYGQRHIDFERFQFDPSVDLRIDPSGAFRWASDKPEMHRFVRDYFRSRREDG
jgi:hypothetical protein